MRRLFQFPTVCQSAYSPYSLTANSVTLFGLSWSQEALRIGSDGALGDTAFSEHLRT